MNNISPSALKPQGKELSDSDIPPLLRDMTWVSPVCTALPTKYSRIEGSEQLPYSPQKFSLYHKWECDRAQMNKQTYSHRVLPARDHKWASAFPVVIPEQSSFSFLLGRCGPHVSFFFKSLSVWSFTPVNFCSFPRELKPKNYWIDANACDLLFFFISLHICYYYFV